MTVRMVIQKVAPVVLFWRCVIRHADHVQSRMIPINARVALLVSRPSRINHSPRVRQRVAVQLSQRVMLSSYLQLTRILSSELLSSSKSTTMVSFEQIQEWPFQLYLACSLQTLSSSCHCQSTLLLSLLEDYQPFIKKLL